jgi:hypothetical protein
MTNTHSETQIQVIARPATKDRVAAWLTTFLSLVLLTTAMTAYRWFAHHKATSPLDFVCRLEFALVLAWLFNTPKQTRTLSIIYWIGSSLAFLLVISILNQKFQLSMAMEIVLSQIALIVPLLLATTAEKRR